jgi:sterol desaturase/sphingolipid hydroxylase (fatty acid hydroxylase superfamily)
MDLFVPRFAVESAPMKATGSFSLKHAFSFANDAIPMTFCTVMLTLLLELASLDAVRSICRRKGGAQLYAQGVLANFVNNCLFGPISYEMVNAWFLSAPFDSWWTRLCMVGTILMGHAVGYYAAHRWMHTRKMYWAHRFHHRFNVFVVPVTANAVSPAEYAIAYMAPFVAGAALLRPDRCSLFIAVGIVSLNNLLIHTPGLCDLSAKYVPWLGVSTADHLEHHKRLTSFYAAPTISIDKLLMLVFGKPESWNQDFDDDTQVKQKPGTDQPETTQQASAAGGVATRRKVGTSQPYPVGA